MSEKNELIPVQSVNDLCKLGDMFARSSMFGINNPGDGLVIATTCHQERMSLMRFMETYHIVEGKPSMKADAMLARLEELGGNYEIISRTPEKAEAKMEYKGRTLQDSFTWELAQKERYIYQKDGKTLKNNWGSPRKRMQMLWARLVSDMVRAICPQANRGSYTPEEVQDFEEDEINVTPPKQTPPKPINKKKAEEALKNAEVEYKTDVKPTQEPVDVEVIDDEVDPFEDEKENAVDYSVCPMGKQTKGKKWTDFSLKELKMAEKIKHENMLNGHYKAIQKAIEAKAMETAKAEEEDDIPF